MIRLALWSLILALAGLAAAQQYNVRKVDDYLYVSQRLRLMRVDIQKEIKLSAADMKSLAKAQKVVEEAEAAVAKAGRGGDRARLANVAMIAGVAAKVEAIRILETLSPGQDARLTELCVQLDAQNLLLFSYSIRGRLKMDEAQAKKIRKVSDEFGQKMSQAMRPTPGAPPPKNPEADRKARVAKAAALGAQRESAMLAVLRPEQRQIWVAAKGKPFGK